MNAKFRLVLKIASPALVIIPCIFLVGCSTDSTEAPAKTPVQTVHPSQPKERIEVRPVGTGETIRRHISDASGVEVETRIEYSNGDKGVMRLRPDGTIENFTVHKANGKLRFDKTLAANGKTVVSGKQMRDDDTIIFQWEKLPGDAVKLTAYWWDGVRVFAVQVTAADGSTDTVYTRKNGKAWAQIGDRQDKLVMEEACDVNGLLSFRRTPKGNSTETTYFRPDGTANFTQIVKSMPNQYGSSSPQLAEVIEYGADGKTVERRLITSGANWRPDVIETTTYNKDGSVTVRKLRPNSDGFVDHETIKDASGKVISDKDLSNDVVRETIDQTRLNMYNYRRDPEEMWNMTETSPYYRDANEY